jgi:hypothetical protein
VIDELGGVTMHTSPIRRAKPAVRYLRSVLSQHDCPVESIAIFAEADCCLHPTAPDGSSVVRFTLLLAHEIAQFSRNACTLSRRSAT